MTSCVDQERGDRHYNEFYESGGWHYSLWREFWWHRKQVAKRFGLRRGCAMLEVACGNGFHTDLFCKMGYRCVGIDRSRSGIEAAKQRFPSRTFHCCDFRDTPYPQESFDVVIARGFSFYHYDLDSVDAHIATCTILRHLKPGGLFVMLILTDRSGRREPGRVWQNYLSDYEQHFASHGRQWSVDWADGMAICSITKPHRVEAAPGEHALIDRPAATALA